MRTSLIFLLLLITTTVVRADERILFETHILPILETRCMKCHGDPKVQGGLDLRRKFTLVRGGDNGPGIVPGKPADSLLLQRIDKNEMPPPAEGALDKRQKELIRRWIADGSPLGKVAEAPLQEKEIPSRVSAEDRQFWAFQPPKGPAVPVVKNVDRERTPIDAFLLAKLEAKGTSFSPDASKEVLLRRLCFDLIGLPPTIEQREAFLADTRLDAYERLVDRLLASPEYGERWGRHWLDLAGYADSDGYLAADRQRPQAWRYRDYVVQSLNADVPYDRFLTEQLAGDEMSDWRRASALTPEMVRQLTATGFLRTALDPTYPGYTEPNEIYQVLSDTMQIVGTTTLGLTIHCAKCHSHKFDPISQRDYYALQSVFLPALDPARWQPSEVRGIPMGSEAEQARQRERSNQAAQRVATLAGQLKTAMADSKKLDKATVEKLKAELAAAQAEQKNSTPILIRGLMDLDAQPPQGRLLRRGDHSKPGAVVNASIPEVLAPDNFKLDAKPGYKTTGRRLALAVWLTNPAHPLTARVQVNRMWAHHFGRGIVPTIANFGRSGAKPSHPELLDWLATEFVRQGWSMKAMHRLMLTSTAYRQSSGTRPDDPSNILLSTWKPRRHEGEVLRDSVLAVAGKLSEQRYGPPAGVVGKGDGSVETPDDVNGNRRSIYLMVRRSQHLTILDLFDTPLMEVNCPERNVSTVPLQALAMLHGPFAERNAAAVGERLLRSAGDDTARIRNAFLLMFAREPRPAESARISKFVVTVKASDGERAAWTQMALVMLNSNEFLFAP
jgi:hypothetical protein